MLENDFKPVPQGDYLPAVRHGNLIWTSGMTPRMDGKLLYVGKILPDKPIQNYKEAVRLATKNAFVAASNCLSKTERINVILQLNVYLNTEVGFVDHAKIADFASEYLKEKLGDQCIGSRVAIGVFTLPSNAPVEISFVANVQ